MLVVRFGKQRQPPTRIERLVVDGTGAKRDPGDGDDADAVILPPDPLARSRVAQVVAAQTTLEPEPEPLAQNSSSLRAASTTRAIDGMYASSICQYGYGTS
jgi:hypothetical protein